MAESVHLFRSSLEITGLVELFRLVRQASRELAQPLSDADATAQSMPDASPAKWHLAHTTWFFETMVLARFRPNYRVYDERFNFLFNSYYESVGARHPRPRRGLITRPSLATVLAYREHVDAALFELLAAHPGHEAGELIELGCHHEQQHQELLLTDILHLFAQNPLRPAYQPATPPAVEDGASAAASATASFLAFEGGVVEIGCGEAGFAFDCEGPRHAVYLQPFAMADRLVTNAEWLEFMQDGGYGNPLLWLSDGWSRVCAEEWDAPLYWAKRESSFWTMTLRGWQPVDPGAPVSHVNYYEADAFAAWAGRRLPTEAEREHATRAAAGTPNLVDSGWLRPKPARRGDGTLRQMFGDVWEWTRSAYLPYPGFRAVSGAVGEYNGKFMSGQFVLRGGSCATPAGHIRSSYRNFFPPEARWQFSGLRLAEDG